MASAGLRWHRCRFKASHNSYERAENLHDQLRWSAGQPWQGGCRGVELDIWRHSGASKGTGLGYFTVAHSSPGNVPLANHLGHLLSYHASDPRHDPVLVTLDVKSSQGSVAVFPEEIDAYLGEWFDRALIYRPSDLRGRSRRGQLIDVVRREGWPSIDALRGRFVFVISGTEAWKRRYADATTPASLCFADADVADDRPYEALAGKLPSNRVFLNLHLFSADFAVWRRSVPRLREDGYIVRGYVLDGKGIWTKGIDAGVNVLSTDKVRSNTWAHVGAEPFAPI
jgi:hypothetical protein